MILLKKGGMALAFSKVLKVGSKVIKVSADIQNTVKTVEESLEHNEFGDVANEEKKAFHSTKRKFTRKKRKGKISFPPIPQPETENKEELYEWMYKESTNILSQLRENIKETCELTPPYRGITFRISDDVLVFKVPSDLGDQWEYFKDCVVLESFALQSRLEKLNKYNFDHEELKRIRAAKEKVKSLSHPQSNFSLANRFYKTDKVLAAYFSREALMKLLFQFTTEEEFEKVMIDHVQQKIDSDMAEVNKKIFNLIIKKAILYEKDRFFYCDLISPTIEVNTLLHYFPRTTFDQLKLESIRCLFFSPAQFSFLQIDPKSWKYESYTASCIFQRASLEAVLAPTQWLQHIDYEHTSAKC